MVGIIIKFLNYLEYHRQLSRYKILVHNGMVKYSFDSDETEPPRPQKGKQYYS